jgi:hypothetical protein
MADAGLLFLLEKNVFLVTHIVKLLCHIETLLSIKDSLTRNIETLFRNKETLTRNIETLIKNKEILFGNIET